MRTMGRGVLTGLCLVLVAGWVVVTWWSGSPVRYVITSGSSMEPEIGRSDLVVLGPGHPEVGDVVAYRSETLDRTILHRVVDRDVDGYVTKGDANDWVDPDRPTDADLLGVRWFRIPGAGRVMVWLRQPVWFALLCAGVTATWLSGWVSARTHDEHAGLEPAGPPGSAG